MKKVTKEDTFCDHQECPLHEQCAWFIVGLDRSNTFHWGRMPYDVRKGSCFYFSQKEEDTPINKLLGWE